MIKLAYFISPHGYGHAARAAAVMAALTTRAEVQFEIFTKVPPWFFDYSLPGGFGYHEVLTDIGLVQQNSLVADLDETARHLDAFLPFDARLVDSLATQVTHLGCQMLLCDIAPLGIAVAHRAGVRSMLVENFTWDWIYGAYEADHPRIAEHVATLDNWFRQADYHIQTEPCHPRVPADLVVPPVSRQLQTAPESIRARLDVPVDAPFIMLTMGGTAWRYTFLEGVARWPDVYFVVPVLDEQLTGEPMPANLRLLPHNSGIFHPDLVNASDALIGKVGYSTLAEVYQAGVAFGYVIRPNFRESAVLSHYVAHQMQGLPIQPTAFEEGQWLDLVPQLLALPRHQESRPNGADSIAAFTLAQL